MNEAKEVELGTDEELNPFPRRRSAYELLKEPEDMTQEEKERLARIKACLLYTSLETAEREEM